MSFNKINEKIIDSHLHIFELEDEKGSSFINGFDEYIEKTKNKTAYLFECTLVCNAMLSSTNVNLKEISELGLEIGIAFQIRDDLLNLSQTDNSKPTNNDIKEGIYNAPIIFAQNTDNYATGIEKTKVLLNNYVQSAKQKIENLPNNKYKEALAEFLELLNNV